MPRLGHVDVWIESADETTRYQEHQTSTKDKKTECFIESKTGDGFNIVVHLDKLMKYHGHDAWKVLIKVDGQLVDSQLMGPRWSNVRRTKGSRRGPTTTSPFQFGKTQFTGALPSRILTSL
jgi:hypothetical protein